LAVEEHFYLFWPLVVFCLARRPRLLIGVCLTVSVSAMLARLIGSLMGLSWWTTYVLTPFRLDGLALGAFLAVTAGETGGVERLKPMLPWAAGVLGGALTLTFAWTRLVSHDQLDFILPVRAAIILMLLGCLLIRAVTAPQKSTTSRFFQSRV